MKNLLFLIPLFFSFLCRSQENFTPSGLNHFAAPKASQIHFYFNESTAVPTNLSIIHKYLLGDPFKMDTLLPPGTRQLKITVPLEMPSLVSVKINDRTDQLFAIPGRPLAVSYTKMEASASAEKEIKNNEDLNAINKYYSERIPVSGNQIDPLATYRAPIRSMTDFTAYSAYYDSLTQRQLALLTEYQAQLPLWFVSYETKNIYYTGLSFKLFMAKRQRYNRQLKEAEQDDYLQLINEIALDDEMAILSLFYTETLKDLALLKYCTGDCFGDSENKWNAYYTAILKLGHQITNKPIQNLYFARTLFLSSRSGQSLPPEMLKALKNGLSDDYVKRIAIPTPGLAGQAAPNFYLKDLADQFHGIGDFKEKVVLLNFWFVGCKGCLSEIAYEQQLARKFEEAPFTLVNICTNSKETDWKVSKEIL